VDARSHLVAWPGDEDAAVNYAALLGVLAAATFTLPLLARLAESLGLPRGAGVAVSLVVAVAVSLGWYARARAAARRRAGGNEP